MSFEDNKVFWEEFILLYQENPCLWDIKSKDYRNKQKKNAAYDILINSCKPLFPNANKEFVIKKMSLLRASFRRQLRRINGAKRTGTGAEDVPEPTLWYFDLLSFLMDQEESRPAVSSILDDNNIEENSHTSDTDSHTQDSTQPLDSSPVLSPATSQSSTSTSRNKRIQKSENTWTKKKHQFLDASLKILQTETAPPHTDKEESQEITFGKNIGQQLQETEDRQKIIAQKLISDVLFYAKLGNLTDSSSISFTHQPAPCQSVSYVPPAQLYQPTYTNNVTPYTQPNAAEVYRPTYANLTSFTPPNVAQAYQPTYTNLNTPSTQSSAAQIFRQTYINHTTSTQPNSNAAGLPFTSQSEVSTPTTDAAAKTTDHVFMDEFLSFDKAKN